MLNQIRSLGAVGTELSQIKQSMTQPKGRWSELLDPHLRPALMVGLGLAIAQQVTGINTVVYYGPPIVKSAGISSASSGDPGKRRCCL